MEDARWIWGYLRRYKTKIILGLFLALMVCMMSLINPYMTKIIVDDVIQGGRTEILVPIAGILLGVTALKTIIRYMYQMMFEQASQNVIFEVRETIYKKIQGQDFEFFNKTRTGDIMARMTGDMEAVRHFVAWVIYMVFENVVVFAAAVIMMFTINVKLALWMLAVTPLTGYLAYKLSTSVRPAFVQIREQFSKLNTVVQENISGNRVIKAFTKEDYEIQKFQKENQAFKERNLEAAKVWEIYLPPLDCLAGILSIIVILIGGAMAIQKELTLGDLVAVNGFIWALNNPMRMAGGLINDVQRFAASLEKIHTLVKMEPMIKNPQRPIDTDRIKGSVEFRNVSFSYGDAPVLKNISFTAHPGQTIAVIGPTGSGKSSLVNLICRFYDATEGEVRLDGVNVTHMDIRKLRNSIASAMQDIFLFSDTIEGNIAYGNPEASMDQVKWAAGAADAHDFIQRFPEGYDTIVGERGVGLSGGQRQRIALARALLKNPAVLILDDTTSSVDMETEHKIHKTLKSFYQDRTTFIIAHRISSVKHADLILVLKEGKVVEQGKHQELLDKKGYYFNVFMNQFGDFDQITAKEVI